MLNQKVVKLQNQKNNLQNQRTVSLGPIEKDMIENALFVLEICIDYESNTGLQNSS